MKKVLWPSVIVLAVFLLVAGCGGAAAPLAYAPEIAPEGGYEYPQPAADAETYARSGVQAAPDLTVERMVIRTGSLDLIVPSTEQALADIQALAEELDGYVVSLNTYQYQQGVQGSVTLRIPAESFDLALQRLKDMATTVRQESVSGQDVTEEYVDLQARLRHLQAKEAQLLEFLDNAEDTEAVLAVYEHLSATQQEIEQVTGRMEYLQDQVALATITVNLTPDALAQPLEVGGWNLPGAFRDAVELLLDVVEFFVKALIFLVIVGLPALILFAAPIVGLVFLIRWVVRLRKRRRAAA